VAGRLGAVKDRLRLAAAALAVLLVALAAYWLFLRQDTVEPRVAVPKPAATIGAGSDAIGVTAGGAIVRWLPLPEDPPLPRLPLDEPPKGGRVKGTALEQVRVLAAVPDALRPYVASSSFGESGVEVELTTGIELRFGDATQAEKKWKAVAAVLADPSVTALDYVNVAAPSKPSFDGEGHELPPAP
jgi:cell division septal protein FtsQ